jgi:hypothetical protein
VDRFRAADFKRAACSFSKCTRNSVLTEQRYTTGTIE